jgi:hypothetical protein
MAGETQVIPHMTDGGHGLSQSLQRPQSPWLEATKKAAWPVMANRGVPLCARPVSPKANTTAISSLRARLISIPPVKNQ